MNNVSLFAIVAAALAVPGWCAPVQNSACGSCHTKQAQLQPQTSMARALGRAVDDPVLKTHRKLTLQQGVYSYTIERQGDQSLYTVTDGKETLKMPITWVFGAGAKTFVLEKSGELYEGLVSYYAAADALDITVGDERIRPATVLEAMGRRLTKFEAQSCFQCHATGAIENDRLALSSLRPGVQCEHCHAGSSKHLQDISRGKLESVPPKLKSLPPEKISYFCGQCHRTWETVVRNHMFGENNVRFQPYRLANSKCFDGNDPRLSCLTCHDPHQEIVRDASTYEVKCLACHSGSNVRTCPVAETNCVGCHMPKVPLAGGHLTFTDHNIAIVRPNQPYPD